jgi:hypothetical protein
VDRAILNRTPPHRPSEQYTDIGRDADSYLDGGVWSIDPINHPKGGHCVGHVAAP